VPSPLCGLVHQSSTDWTTDLQIQSTVPDVTATIGSGSALSAKSYFGGIADFGQVTFVLGANSVSAEAREPSGNTAALPTPCVVIVGEIPVVTWVAPAVGQNLCAWDATSTTCIADGSSSSDGWQGDLRVHVTLKGSAATTGTVTFSSPFGTIGTPATVDASGDAVLAVSLANANPLVITAKADDVTGAAGPGSASVSTIVDTAMQAPGRRPALARPALPGPPAPSAAPGSAPGAP
jgi:hypothetical protein